jgi:hypothetical protein
MEPEASRMMAVLTLATTGGAVVATAIGAMVGDGSAGAVVGSSVGGGASAGGVSVGDSVVVEEETAVLVGGMASVGETAVAAKVGSAFGDSAVLSGVQAPIKKNSITMAVNLKCFIVDLKNYSDSLDGLSVSGKASCLVLDGISTKKLFMIAQSWVGSWNGCRQSVSGSLIWPRTAPSSSSQIRTTNERRIVINSPSD